MKALLCVMDSPGLALQMFGLGRALEAIGHTVGYVANPKMAAMCDAFAARRISCEDALDSFTLHEWSSVGATQRQAAELQRASDVFAPDVLVATPFGYGPAICSELTGIPLAILGGLTFLWNSGTWRREHGLHSFDAARVALGLPPIGEGGLFGHPPWLGDRVLLQSVPALVGPGVADERIACVGDCTWDPSHTPDPALAAWLANVESAGRSLVYAQWGREFGVTPIDELLAAVADDLGLAVVIDTARSDQPRGYAREWVHARHFIARSTVLPRCRLVVGSGQPTIVLGALSHRIPLVLLANGSGTEEAAAACNAVGVARVGTLATTTFDTLRLLVSEALDGRMQSAIDGIASQLERAGGLPRAAQLVAKLVDDVRKRRVR